MSRATSSSTSTTQTTTAPSAPVSRQTTQLTSYNQNGTGNDYSKYTKGATVTSDAGPSVQNHWDVNSALQGLGTVHFASEATHFTGNLQNYGAQIYNMGMVSGNSNTSSIPDGWRTMGSAVQFNLLNNEELQFAQSIINQLTLNPPSSVQPLFNTNSTSLSHYSSPSQDQRSGNYPDSYRNNPLAQQERNGGTFSLEKAYIAKQEISKGAQLISKFIGVGSDAEATSLLGESALESASSGAASLFSTVGMEEAGVGLVAGASELLGGAATVGAAVVGAEVLAGAAVVGLGIYEGYRAFGGTEDLSSITGKISSGVSHVAEWGERIAHWVP